MSFGDFPLPVLAHVIFHVFPVFVRLAPPGPHLAFRKVRGETTVAVEFGIED
jgi:hypothetical protein